MDQRMRFGSTVLSIIRHRANTPHNKRVPTDRSLIEACLDCDDQGLRIGFALNRRMNPIARRCSHYAAIAGALAMVEGFPTSERQSLLSGEGRAEALLAGLAVLKG